jgi:hypothetical protein
VFTRLEEGPKMAGTIRYFALQDWNEPEPTGLFRELKSDDSYSLEYWTHEQAFWQEDMDALLGYLWKGETGSHEITEREAEKLKKALTQRAKSRRHYPGGKDHDTSMG